MLIEYHKIMTHTYSRNVSQDQINITCSISFFKDPTFKPNRCNGSNRLYVANKKNSYFLVDMAPCERDYIVHSNSKMLNLTNVHSFRSASLRPNTRYVISHFLTLFFKTQQTVPNRVRNRTFNRLRILLINQWNALQARLKKDNQSNRSTKSFIRFSYKTTTYYLGFYMPCSRCQLPAAQVLSRQRSKCHIHDKFNVTTPQLPLQPDHMTLNAVRTKTIVKTRLNLQYKKCTRSYQSVDKRFGRVTYLYDIQHIKEELPGSLMHQKYSRRRLKSKFGQKLSKHLLAQHNQFSYVSGWDKIHFHHKNYSHIFVNRKDFVLVRGGHLRPPTIESKVDITTEYFLTGRTYTHSFRKRKYYSKRTVPLLKKPPTSKPQRTPSTPAPTRWKPPPRYLGDLVPYVRDNNLQQLLFEDYDTLITQYRNDKGLRQYTDNEKRNPFWEIRERSLKKLFQ